MFFVAAITEKGCILSSKGRSSHRAYADRRLVRTWSSRPAWTSRLMEM